MADHAVSESIYIHDPDFNGIEVYSDRNPKEWEWKDHSVQMVTEPLNVKDLFKEAIDADNKWNVLPAKTSIGHYYLHVSNRYEEDLVELNYQINT
jgi:catechol 2,3-dioxygenase